jgi:nucleoside-triphosphatase THEP1
MKDRLSEKWIKASIAGTIWAASEIVLGSFLHNLRVPFSGNILTAIGIIILVSVSYIWTEGGLFWRAGLICALMKTLSPSAVIFGPMIAIFTEALLLEIFVWLFGRGIVGFVLGSMLAMSWNLLQKILNYIIYYGSNIIDVYSDLLKLAQKQLNLKTDIVWMPVIILLVLYAIFGMLAAITGMKVGRKMAEGPTGDIPVSAGNSQAYIRKNSGSGFNYSVAWLFADLFFLVGSFIVINRASWIVWVLTTTSVVGIWAVRYNRALRQLSKPGFWIFFILITLLTAFLFTRAEAGESTLLKGLLTGVQMNFRAAVIIVGFSVIGTELYNPIVRNFFNRTSFRNLPLALELSAESLPMFIAGIPDFRTIRKNPVSIFSSVMGHATRRLEEIRERNAAERSVFIITGSIRGGKTSFARKVIVLAEKADIKTGGILSERITDESKTTGYDIMDIVTGDRKKFLREKGDCSSGSIGRFGICREGLSAGRKILGSFVNSWEILVIIDEVGLLELQDGGWSGSIKSLLDRSGNNILMTVRDIYVEEVKRKWNLMGSEVINISNTDTDSAALLILSRIASKKDTTLQK